MTNKSYITTATLLLLLVATALFANSNTKEVSITDPGIIATDIARTDTAQNQLSETAESVSDKKTSDAEISNPKKPSQPTSVTDQKPNARQLADVKKTKNYIFEDGIKYPLRVYKPALTPNDPGYSQWWVAPNQMTDVWDIPAGAYQTKIAVIDTGFALNHQDLAGRWAINSGESGATASENPSILNCSDRSLPINLSCNLIDDDFDGIVDNETGSTLYENPSDLNCTDQALPLNKSCNNIDDDGNGYVDDVSGWDFSNFDASPQAGEVYANGVGTRHGTSVAGVLGATGNNGVGVAGVNWHTTILPIQALDDFEYGDTYTVSESIRYAADQDADIISISLGTSYNDPYLRSAMRYAIDKGSLIIAASGNDGCNCISYPANYPEVIAVGALAPDGNPASFSSYGANLDILAPGQSITTTYFTASNQTSNYATVSGTSFATPFVAGLFGLAKMSQPDASWEEIVGTMFENSDRRDLTYNSPRSNTLGYGVVHSKNMLDRLRQPFSKSIRYQFGGGEIAGTSRIFQCQDSEIPGLPFYQLKKSGIFRYTANIREYTKAINSGWSAKKLYSVCTGLQTDSVDVLRVIDIPRETLNKKPKQ